MRTRLLILSLAVLTAMSLVGLPASGHNEGIPSLPRDSFNVEHVYNLPNLVGNNIDWFERVDDDGDVSRYLVAATIGNGFDIVDITSPEHPVTVGRYLLDGDDPTNLRGSSLGSNFHAWVSVNPRRNIVALTIEDPGGRTIRHNGGGGIQFVDITDVASPVPLGKIDGLDGPHTVRMIGDNHAFTSLNTSVVDYTDPMNPFEVLNEATVQIEGHEFWEDPNSPGDMWVGAATSIGRFRKYDISADVANPTLALDIPLLDVGAAHEVYPAPDGSYVGIADFTSGQTDLQCPGGGVHFYDISGKYIPGAGPNTPKDMGEWFAPFTGITGEDGEANSASCTMHSWHQHPERSLALGGLYTGGTWVFNPAVPTGDGDYTEYDGDNGTTSWGQTLGNFVDTLDFVNAAQFLPFDLTEDDHERLFVVSGFERGVDIYRYTGDLPKKLADLEAEVDADGVVTGSLRRFAVLGPDGYQQLPLAGQPIDISAAIGGLSSEISVTTAADGSFTANVPRGAVATITWDGGPDFEPKSLTVTP